MTLPIRFWKSFASQSYVPLPLLGHILWEANLRYVRIVRSALAHGYRQTVGSPHALDRHTLRV